MTDQNNKAAHWCKDVVEQVIQPSYGTVNSGQLPVRWPQTTNVAYPTPVSIPPFIPGGGYGGAITSSAIPSPTASASSKQASVSGIPAYPAHG